MQKHDKMMQHVIVVRCWEHAHTHTHTRRLVVNPSPHTPPLYTTPSSPRHHCALPLLCDPDIAWALRDFDVLLRRPPPAPAPAPAPAPELRPTDDEERCLRSISRWPDDRAPVADCLRMRLKKLVSLDSWAKWLSSTAVLKS